MKNQKLSAIIIAKNAEKQIKDCLESLNFWVFEIIVVDTGSIDETCEIAKKYGARVIKYTKGSFSDWRNKVAREAKGDGFLYIDADERVTPLLRKEIESRIIDQESSISAYAIPRKNILLGRKMKYGGWWPDYVVRLIKKEAFDKWEGELHEQPKIKGSVGKLENPLIHVTHRSLTEMVDKTNEWSEIEARLLYESNHPQIVWWRFFSVALREFWYRAIKKKGFLDGTVGIIEIVYQIYSRMITYAKLWELQVKSQNSNVKSQN
jgi:glycosyltransferase involved in cell wall biosynthesis